MLRTRPSGSLARERVNNPDRSPLGINRSHAAPTPSGLAEIVSDNFPVLHFAAYLRSQSDVRINEELPVVLVRLLFDKFWTRCC